MTAGRRPVFSAAEVEALFRPFERAKALLIAVSGGPDSTAHVSLGAHGERSRGRPKIVAATVDHGLRAESAAEADAVARLCARLGIKHATLRWKGAKPATLLQERAREARYRLLVDHARAIRADAILTAHHADDQAETVLFRLLRGSGVAGLRGMEAFTAREGITIARPLIGAKKSALIDYCRARGFDFVEDPSNADPRFARTRLRALIKSLSEEGLDDKALGRLARRAAETEEALAHMTAEVEAKLGAEGAIDARALYSAPIAIVERVLARRIAVAGGRDPSRIGLEKIETLALNLRQALKERKAHSANLGGALVKLSAKGALPFTPEPPRTSGKR